MPVLETLQLHYPDKEIINPININDIPGNNAYMVYILTYQGSAIVVGHGKRNRARVILDNIDRITSGHIKAILVRLYHLYGEQQFERFILPCDNKEESKNIENHLHQLIGGNNTALPDNIKNQIFEGVTINSGAYMVMQIALCSSFDGLSDIRRWRNRQIISNDIWDVISKKFSLHN